MTGSPHTEHGKVKKSQFSTRLERHSGTGRSGAPKKGGGGGKHTWGVAGHEFEDDDLGAVDPSDPNYIDDEQDEPGKEVVETNEGGSKEPVSKIQGIIDGEAAAVPKK